MIAAGNERTICDVGQSVAFGDRTFEVVKKFVYLGSPVLMYGNETWVFTKREEKQLLVFEKKVLRTICGPKLENGVHRRRYNFELQREFGSPCVINIVKTNRLRHAGHMIRRPEDLPQKTIFIARPQGTRRQGRPKFRWVDRVNSNSRAFEALDWTNRA
jgi:hypothetical protein